jgi:hypothetical protein
MTPGEVVAVEVELYSRHVDHVEFDLTGVGKVVAGFSVDLLGWSIRNMSASTVATLDIYDGADTSGSVVVPLVLAANLTDTKWFGDAGVRFRNAVYLNATAQETKGTIWFRRRPQQ